MNDSRLTEQISIYILSKPYYFSYLRIDNINSSARQNTLRLLNSFFFRGYIFYFKHFSYYLCSNLKKNIH